MVLAALTVPRGHMKATAAHTKSAARALAALGGTVVEAPLSTLEATLGAWTECRPEGLTVSEDSLPEAIPVIASYVASCRPLGAEPQKLAILFSTRDEGEPPLFQRMLKARKGRVQFLHFWRAFSKAAALHAGQSDGGSTPSEGLALELETLRDSVLRLLDSPAHEETEGDAWTCRASMLSEAHRVASSMSQNPDFWAATGATLCNLPKGCDLSRDDIAIIMLQWLRCAIAWGKHVDAYPEKPLVRKFQTNGLPVFLHIYDVSQEETIHRLNKWLAHKNSPLKFGGIFHAGVEVNGLEWSFGQSMNETMPGVSCCEPREHPAHRYRQTVRLQNTRLSLEEIADLISQLLEDWPGDDYDLLRRNCCHFADDFVRRLGAGKLPRWVQRLAKLGARMDSLVQAVSGRPLLPELGFVVDDSSDESEEDGE